MYSQAEATDMFDKKHHIVTTWKANIYFKVILLKSGSLLLMCQHTHRGSYMDFGGGSHKISAVVKCDGYVSLGFFFLNQRKEVSAFIRFSEIFITGRKAGQQVIQIHGLKLSAYLQCTLQLFTF